MTSRGETPLTIRVNMYTWADERGVWLATRVRQLWDSGCDVAVLTSIMSRILVR